MSNLFHDLTALIGQLPDSPAVQACLENLGKPSEVISMKRLLHYGWPSHGITVMFIDGPLNSVIFHLNTAAVEARSYKPFDGELPGGIRLGDLRADVQRKIGHKPFMSDLIQGRKKRDPQHYWDYYKVEQYEILIICDGATGEISMLTVRQPIDRPPAVLDKISQKVRSALESLKGNPLSAFADVSLEVIANAQKEARALGHDFVGSEHILVGLLITDGSVASNVLASAGLSPERARAELEHIIGRGDGSPDGELPFTPRAKHVVGLAVEEARQMGRKLAEPEHLLLALLDDGQGVAVRILQNLEIDEGELLKRLLKAIDKYGR